MQISGLIIFCLAIAGIATKWEGEETTIQLYRDLFIVILVFILFMGVFAAFHIWMKKQSGSNNYDVEQQQQNKTGADNKAFEKDSENKQSGPGGKWTKNYVPFKDFPKGTEGSKEVQQLT